MSKEEIDIIAKVKDKHPYALYWMLRHVGWEDIEYEEEKELLETAYSYFIYDYYIERNNLVPDNIDTLMEQACAWALESDNEWIDTTAEDFYQWLINETKKGEQELDDE